MLVYIDCGKLLISKPFSFHLVSQTDNTTEPQKPRQTIRIFCIFELQYQQQEFLYELHLTHFSDLTFLSQIKLLIIAYYFIRNINFILWAEHELFADERHIKSLLFENRTTCESVIK